MFSGGIVTCPVDDPTPLPGAEIALGVLPAEYYGRSPEGIYLLTAGKIGQMGPGPDATARSPNWPVISGSPRTAHPR